MAILIVPILALALSPVHAVLVTNFLSVFIGVSEIRRLLREAEEGTVAVRTLGEKDQRVMSLEEAIDMLRTEATPPDLR